MPYESSFSRDSIQIKTVSKNFLCFDSENPPMIFSLILGKLVIGSQAVRFLLSRKSFFPATSKLISSIVDF